MSSFVGKAQAQSLSGYSVLRCYRRFLAHTLWKSRDEKNLRHDCPHIIFYLPDRCSLIIRGSLWHFSSILLCTRFWENRIVFLKRLSHKLSGCCETSSTVVRLIALIVYGLNVSSSLWRMALWQTHHYRSDYLFVTERTQKEFHVFPFKCCQCMPVPYTFAQRQTAHIQPCRSGVRALGQYFQQDGILIHTSSSIRLPLLSPFSDSCIHSGHDSISPALRPRSHRHLSFAVGDKVRLWRQVVLAVGRCQLVHLLHGGAVLLGGVCVPAAQRFCGLPALQHAGVGDGVRAKS